MLLPGTPLPNLLNFSCDCDAGCAEFPRGSEKAVFAFKYGITRTQTEQGHFVRPPGALTPTWLFGRC